MNTGSFFILFFLRYQAIPQHLNKNYTVIIHIQVLQSRGNITSRNLRFWVAKIMVGTMTQNRDLIQKANLLLSPMILASPLQYRHHVPSQCTYERHSPIFKMADVQGEGSKCLSYTHWLAMHFDDESLRIMAWQRLLFYCRSKILQLRYYHCRGFQSS
jgi:hypothetical protein